MESNPSSKDLKELRNDLLYILNLTHLIDAMYGRNDSETYHYLKRLRKITDNFNEKYPKITVAVDKSYLNIKLKFYIEEKNTSEVFQNFESSLKDRIFKNNPTVEFKSHSEKTYPHTVQDTLALQRNPNRRMVELIYREDTLHNPKCPEFKLLATYALSNYNKDIDIKEDIDSTFCFDFNPDDQGGGFMYIPRTFTGEAGY